MKKKHARRTVFLLGLSVSGLLIGSSSTKKAEEPAPTQGAQKNEGERTAWYRAAKFGMFIHWGAYSVAGVEASWPIMRPEAQWNITQAEYVSLFRRFNPTRYDPKAWVELAKQAGQRYMVITTKHHDGFCMFDSALTDYKITRTPYGKDVIAMLSQAAQEAGMPLGFYYRRRTCTTLAIGTLPSSSRTPGTVMRAGRSGHPTSITWRVNCGNC